jgi:prepilin-type N-terminal cleavage/methylation domain-containing protein
MKSENQKRGFTIVEMLTVMGIIAVLIGLLVPALNQVKDYTKRVQQKVQFHSIDVAVEMFKNDFGAYPESNDNSLAPVSIVDPLTYCGANKLAEAMVGWDLLGFHPKSGFTATGINDLNGDGTAAIIYEPISGFTEGTYAETGKQNIDSRKKYIDLENANAFQMIDVYQNYGLFRATNFVLCDIYAKKRHAGKKTGMPILYYRARTAYQFQDSADTNGAADDTYYFYDNANLMNLNSAEDSTILHPVYANGGSAADFLSFDEMIVNKDVQNATMAVTPGGVRKSYRAESYILISAGKDGLYGTSDDIFNFDKGTEQ